MVALQPGHQDVGLDPSGLRVGESERREGEAGKERLDLVVVEVASPRGQLVVGHLGRARRAAPLKRGRGRVRRDGEEERKRR